jgi:UDPglucose 6-dehydrogenase
MRIGPKSYLSPGGPFAGGTLARDIEFLVQESGSKGLSVPLISSVKLSNDAHKNWIRRKVKATFSDISKITFTLWGLTYKPGTDTLRRSLAVELCDWIINSGGSVNLYDPVVKEIPDKWLNKVKQFQNPLEALKNSNALIIGTEWPQFKEDAKEIESQKNKDLVIFDPNRHILNSINLNKLNYIAVGTPQKNINHS